MGEVIWTAMLEEKLSAIIFSSSLKEGLWLKSFKHSFKFYTMISENDTQRYKVFTIPQAKVHENSDALGTNWTF